jgi:3-hydroxyacyl-CoA dehydrogenase/enoyl-CoA hydratase/3-hydroxybutyryl-CoA epimerase
MSNWKLESYPQDTSIKILTIDKENSSANVLSKSVLSELKDILIQLRKPDNYVAKLIIRSAKKSGFILGADVTEFDGVTGLDAINFVSKNHEILRMIKDLPFTTICLIEGFALGGGTELALMCDYIIAADTKSTRIGLPEIQLGIFPGYGGLYNTIKRMGDFNALNYILSSKPMPAKLALKQGLIDQVVMPSGLLQAAINFKEFVKMPKGRILGSTARSLLAIVLRRGVEKKADPRFYPAPYALINHWETFGADENVEKDSVAVQKLFDSSEAKGLMRCFHLQDGLKKLPLHNEFNSKTEFKRVHVVGAGVMGADIASWCAVKGFRVTLHDINKEALGRAVKRTHATMNKIKAFDAKDRFVADISGDGARNADIIIEAVLEDVDIKTKVLQYLESIKKPSAILATNTSSIMIEKLQAGMKQPEHLLGLHFFNPVAQMLLVELVLPEKYNTNTYDRLAVFTKAIGKLPLPVKSHPGFLVNRVLLPYMSQAIRLVEEGYSPDLIDKAALDFGMPMGPLKLGDTVGLDICLHVGSIFEEQLGKEYAVPNLLKTMVADGDLGVKSGKGFYRKGKSVKFHNGTILERRGTNQGNISFEKKSSEDISKLLHSVFVDECRKVLDEGIIESAEHLDAGIIFATGFCPSSGGPSSAL